MSKTTDTEANISISGPIAEGEIPGGDDPTASRQLKEPHVPAPAWLSEARPAQEREWVGECERGRAFDPLRRGDAGIVCDRAAPVDRLWRQWSPGLSLDPALQAELHEHLRASMPAPLKYYRGLLRPGMLGAMRRLSQPITVPLLQLHGTDDGCILLPQVDDRHRFAAPHALDVVPGVGHFLHIEAPPAIADRIAAWAE